MRNPEMMRKTIIVCMSFMLLLSFSFLVYGEVGDFEGSEEYKKNNSGISQESIEQESLSYAPVYHPAAAVKESYAYYNPHAGQIVEVSASQSNISGNTRNASALKQTVPTRSFYNRHAGQQVEVPAGDTPRNTLKETLISSPKEKKVMRYNSHANEWQRVSPEASLTFNPRVRTWSYQSEGAYPRYNPYADAWEEASSDEKLTYDSESNAWSYQK